MRRALTLVLALTALSSPAAALELRSDLPLWGAGESRERVWPEHFTDQDGLGCVLNLKPGDWRFRETDDSPNGPFDWLRISHYGVFHCAAQFVEAHRREALAGAAADIGYIIELGRADNKPGAEELFALQLGMHSSRYVLLAASNPAEVQTVQRYRVLEPDCPRANVRRGPTIDSFITSYCVVNDRRTLIAVARAAARKPSERWLERVGDFDPPEGG